jgi:hypothetical protein
LHSHWTETVRLAILRLMTDRSPVPPSIIRLSYHPGANTTRLTASPPESFPRADNC